MFSKLKQINDLRKKANTIKKTLAQETISVENRALKMTIDGNQEIQALEISKEFLSPDKKSELEKSLKDGFHEAIKKVQRKMASTVKDMGGLDLPGF